LPSIDTKTERGDVDFMPRLHISEHGFYGTLLMLLLPLQNVDAFIPLQRCGGAAPTRFCQYSDAADCLRVGRCAAHLQFLPDIAAKWSDQMRDVVRILCDQSSWWKAS